VAIVVALSVPAAADARALTNAGAKRAIESAIVSIESGLAAGSFATSHMVSRCTRYGQRKVACLLRVYYASGRNCALWVTARYPKPSSKQVKLSLGPATCVGGQSSTGNGTGTGLPGGNNPPSNDNGGQQGAQSATYTGTLTTTIRYLTVCGTNNGDETTQLAVQVVVTPPLRPTPLSPGLPAAVGQEQNPLHLNVGETTVNGNLERGSISLASALRFGGTSPGLILQYWNLQWDGRNITGRLAEDHREQAAAINLLSTPTELVPCQAQFGYIPNMLAIAEGATLEGTLTNDAINIRVRGVSVDGTRPFVSDIAANRSG
jgi:hypothetical protein